MFTYLACPYADPRTGVRELRAKCASQVAMIIMQRGTAVFSPLSQGEHVKTAFGSNPLSHSEWLTVDFKILKYATYLSVLELPGWEKSKGVTSEVNWCEKHEIPITRLKMGNYLDGDYIHKLNIWQQQLD